MEIIETNPNYWDCECPADYIHAKAVHHCIACEAHQDDQPDSREAELPPRLRCDVGVLCKMVNGMVIQLTCCPCGCGVAFCEWCSQTYHIVRRRAIKEAK
jgi:hypothetical protein